MGARIIHFGFDDCHRVPVLRCAGYSIADCQSIAQLHAALQSTEEARAVVMARVQDLAPQRAVSITRAISTAPMVLFPCGAADLDESEFDLVIPALTPPEQWLSDIADLIQRCHSLRSQFHTLRAVSIVLRQESADAVRRSRHERRQSGTECAKNRELLGGAGIHADAEEQLD